MTDWEATQLRLKQRTEDARQRADEVRQRYVELGRRVGSSRQQVNRAAQAAREATDNAVAAQEALIEGWKSRPPRTKMPPQSTIEPRRIVAAKSAWNVCAAQKHFVP